ncbi:transcriptional repressor LexA [Deinococcus yavapaiensis]|uniref:SOS-response transcriptional repressor LexA n=1 Tax=Deinococcus yavapaiensis KR-236 TaxID=694435 RepID=A0A318SAE1_9DEIO|nr:transcriptional repressor LexA [Deinococcus yavapaiensis]PYE56319.1 SOS-response transcriptional repressor LexA [Deinococcus yavapaiensis KR-236]
MPPRLTDRRKAILRTLAKLQADLGRPVTTMELAAALGTTRQAVQVHLAALEHLGFLAPRVGHAPLTLTDAGRRELSTLPLVGEIAAGEPILADERVDGHAAMLSDVLDLREGDYLLRVRGDSMVGVGINPGDVVVVRPGSGCLAGEIAVVLLPGESTATLKRFYLDGGTVTLVSENPAYAPMTFPAEAVRVQGCLVGHVGGPKPRRSRA